MRLTEQARAAEWAKSYGRVTLTSQGKRHGVCILWPSGDLAIYWTLAEVEEALGEEQSRLGSEVFRQVMG